MLFDKQSMFSDAQAITASAASENIIDLGAPGTPQHAAAAITQDLGRGRPIPIIVQVTETFATLTSLTVTVQKDTVEGFGSPEAVLLTPAIPVASLVAGFQFPILYLPHNLDQRFVRLNYAVAGSNATAGKVTAGLVYGRAQWTS